MSHYVPHQEMQDDENGLQDPISESHSEDTDMYTGPQEPTSENHSKDTNMPIVNGDADSETLESDKKDEDACCES